MENSYFIAGIQTKDLFRLIGRNGMSFHPRYLGRFAFLLFSSFWTSAISKVENIRFARKIQNTDYSGDPVIIVGHWRSGSTYLHQLTNLCPELAAPTMFHIGNPDSFMSSRKIIEPVIQLHMRSKRTVDNVAMGLDEPQEDEFALLRMTTHSPVEKLIFPEGDDYFLKESDFMPPRDAHQEWKDALVTFCKKIYLQTGKRVVLKNPFHSMRIPLLRELFPRAKFIHIHRNPLKVIPSTVRMWTIVGEQNTLKDNFTPPPIEQVCEVHNRMLWKIREDFKALPESDRTEIRFEDLEQQPLDMMRQVCSFLDMPFTKEYRQNLEHFLSSTRNYQKNRYAVSSEDQATIRAALAEHMAHYGYAAA
jgi:hypothetical protein